MMFYNIKRCINILGFDVLMQKLNAWKPTYKREWLYSEKTDAHACVIATLYFETPIAA